MHKHLPFTAALFSASRIKANLLSMSVRNRPICSERKGPFTRSRASVTGCTNCACITLSGYSLSTVAIICSALERCSAASAVRSVSHSSS
ncbi:Uncharacterised protein [Vibrio cholerae]|nr:Uncharacterised protein [Vibrio cholerae]CSB56146.1 Uncharacterised protein [Vibrio cholerae]